MNATNNAAKTNMKWLINTAEENRMPMIKIIRPCKGIQADKYMENDYERYGVDVPAGDYEYKGHVIGGNIKIRTDNGDVIVHPQNSVRCADVVS